MEVEPEEQQPLLMGDSDTELYFPVAHTPRNSSGKAYAKTTGYVKFTTDELRETVPLLIYL